MKRSNNNLRKYTGGCIGLCLLPIMLGGFYGQKTLGSFLLHNLNKKKCHDCDKIINNVEKQSKTTIARIMDKDSVYNKLYSKLRGASSQYYGKRSSVMIKVPDNVKKVALYSFKLKKLGFKGGLETGWKRAKQLSTKNEISIQDLKYMRAWFARHIITSYPTYKKWIKAGRPKTSDWFNRRGIIAWLIWSGNAGFKWVNSQKNINLLNKHYPGKNYKSMSLKL